MTINLHVPPFFPQTWDDVIRKTKPKEQPFNYKVLHRLDEEKSKLSLAEVYEQEYIRQTQVRLYNLLIYC